MRIVLSALFSYYHRPSKEFFDAVEGGTRRYLSEFPDDSVFLNVSNNACDTPIIPEFHRIFSIDSLPGFKPQLVNQSFNESFNAVHNNCFVRFPCDIFVVLSGNLVFPQPDWLILLRNAILDGFSLVTTPVSEDTEGSALAVRSEDALRHGLFASDLDTAYHEISDLLLRYESAGLKISRLNIPHDHVQNSESLKISPALLRTMQENDRSRFLSRWGTNLKNRKFTNRFLIVLNCVGFGDVICSLPAILKLSGENPYVQFDLALHLGYTSCLFENLPNISMRRLISSEFIIGEKEIAEYDRIFVFSDVRATSANYLAREVAANMGVDFDARQAQTHLRGIAKAHSPDIASGKKIAAFHFEYLRNQFHGRGVHKDAVARLAGATRQAGYAVVNIGTEPNHLRDLGIENYFDLNLAGKLDFPNLIGLIGAADLFVGMDSGPMHIAQFLGVPSFLVFGATLPAARVLDWRHTGVYMQWDLECLACYHLFVNSFVPNRCARVDQACVQKISLPDIEASFGAFLKGDRTSAFAALDVSQKIVSRRTERDLRLGSEKRIIDLENALAKYESGPMKLFFFFKSLLRKIPGLKKIYTSLKRRSD